MQSTADANVCLVVGRGSGYKKTSQLKKVHSREWSKMIEINGPLKTLCWKRNASRIEEDVFDEINTLVCLSVQQWLCNKHPNGICSNKDSKDKIEP